MPQPMDRSRREKVSKLRRNVACPQAPRAGQKNVDLSAWPVDRETHHRSLASEEDLRVLVAKRLDQALAGDDRLSRAHAGRGIVRQITPLSSGSPASRSPSA